MAQLSVALAMARGFLNDVTGQVWSDPNLIPYLQQAHYELQTDLWVTGSPVIRGVTGPIFVPSGPSPNINGSLPSDFLIPTHADECGVTSTTPIDYTDLAIDAVLQNVVSSAAHPFVVGQIGGILQVTGGAGFVPGFYGIVFVDGSGNATLSENVGIVGSIDGTGILNVNDTDDNWIPMTEQFFLPLTAVPGPTLVWWSYREETLILIGSTANRFINFQYRRQIPIPQLATDPIGMIFGELYLGARGGAIAAGSTGNDGVEAKLDALAKQNFAKVVMANRGQQKPVTKP
jgi:hypothetical protein